MRRNQPSLPSAPRGADAEQRPVTGSQRAGVAFTGGLQATSQTEPVQHSGSEPGAPAGAPQLGATFFRGLGWGSLFAGAIYALCATLLAWSCTEVAPWN